MGILTSRQARIASVLLIVQAAIYYALPASEVPRRAQPLSALSAELGTWRMSGEFPIESSVQEVLKADQTLNRNYGLPSGDTANLYVAFFKTQSTGVAPHSPRNCLPGSGWTWRESGKLAIRLGNDAAPAQVNRYVIEKGASRSLVLYWYQTGRRVVAGEYAAKLHTVLDRARNRRSDLSLVRIVVPVGEQSGAQAQERAVAFAQAVFEPLTALLPQ
jgi:EpsI family protein